MGAGGGGVGELRTRRRWRGLFRALICAARVPGTPLPTRDNTAPCRECILHVQNPSDAGTELAMVKRIGGGGVHKSDQSLLSFAGSELSHHLRHVDVNRGGGHVGPAGASLL